MPRFIIERSIPPMSRDELAEAARRSKQAIAAMDGIVWIKSYISEADGKIYCEYEAPNAALLWEHARRAGLPIDRVSEIGLEVSPDMFV
ncbi:MAG: DUF4242 domain-containing protein [Vicinamibacterales bacterium]